MGLVMNYYYHFVRETRRFSLIVFMNACLLAIMYWWGRTYLLDEESDPVVFGVVVIIELILLGISIYLWSVNKKIGIKVSAREFYYCDPLFGENELVLYVDDIDEIIQVQSATNRIQRNLLRLKDGSVHELMYQNYNIDKQAMFDALNRANPKIKLPASIWIYEQTRPQWAKEVRKKMGLDE